MSDDQKVQFCVVVAFVVAALLVVIIYGQQWQT
jgi:hypothetical protein